MALHSLRAVGHGPPSIKPEAVACFSPTHHIGPHGQLSQQQQQQQQQKQQQQQQEHSHQPLSACPEEISPSILNPQLSRLNLECLQQQRYPHYFHSRPSAAAACCGFLALPPTTISSSAPRPAMDHCCPSSSIMEFQMTMVRPQISYLDAEENFSSAEDMFNDPLSAMQPNPRFHIPPNGDDGIRNVPLPGVRCPKCAKDGKEVWVIPGRACGYCGTACV